MVEYMDFKIKDVLEWQSQKEIDPLKIEDLSVKSDDRYPFYGQATINNGIISYLSLTDSVLNNKMSKPTILIHSNNQNVVYLETPFYLKDGHGATSVLQSDSLNELTALYLMTCIKKVITKKFSYNEKATKIALKNTLIKLPVTPQGEINYAYMESYIIELRAESISELTDYLKVNGLEDYNLNNDETEALNRYKNGEVRYQNFRAEELFLVKSNPQLNKDSFIFTENKGYPYFTRTVANNGIAGYVEYFDEEHKIAGNSIAVGMLGMSFFYMENDFYAGQFTKTIFPKFSQFDEVIAQYFIAWFNKSSNIYKSGLVRNFERLFYETNLMLPVNENGEIDFEFIQSFIKAQEKLSIIDVVDWRDKEIIATKRAIRGNKFVKV